MMSRAWAVGILAAAVVVGLPLRAGQPGEACVIVYSDEHFECTGDGYCAQRCDDQWEPAWP